MKLRMQGTMIQHTFYILELGMDWLTTLEDMEVNFQNQTIKWRMQGQECSIKEDASLNNMEVSLKTMAHILQQTGHGYKLYCEGQGTEQDKNKVQDEVWKEIVKQFP
ncbi:unnamed protein product [Cuscuta europaea]|uniref:Uncharacterized protein n=1 Tax=Cuscuta europaea TaxID=41803 RepID=A0A9P0ZYL8_CUSEU|nr:unnamed protein product [Cuscuta europaea]